ncbi:MAG: 4Fe-4S binding protein, partial [Chloroflexota bacterium]
MRRKIGVFVCHCGLNIAGTVDVARVAATVRELDGVVYSADYSYMCSEPGQRLIEQAIREHDLDGVVVCSCSPRMHEITFRNACRAAGLNGYRCEIANIREQCSWVHKDREVATRKAIGIAGSAVEKVRGDEPLAPIEIPVTRRALVVGAGIAGMQAALDIVNGGHEVLLVDRLPSIGGKMHQLSETFPTLDCAQCTLTPKMVEVGQHPGIRLLTYSELESVSGYVGNFDVRIRRKRSYVDWDRCNGCGLCQEKCPAKTASGFDRGLAERKAIYTLSAQAVPNKPVIDPESCIYFKTGKCRACEKLCPVGAIDFDQGESAIEERVGAIVAATGFELYDKALIPEYGAGSHRDVLDGLEFERLLSASGPTAGQVRRPSDGREPKEVVFIQCVGSRDPERGVSHCSKVCCMYTAKHVAMLKRKVPDAQAYVFYMDIRTAGKGYEEFFQRVVEESGPIYLRGRVARLYEEDGKIVVWGADTHSGKKIEVRADLVVLAMAMMPSSTALELAQQLRIATDQVGFFSEAHPKLRPVETLTQGIYLAGVAQGPKDVPESVTQASGAASKVLTLFSKPEMVLDPLVAAVQEDLCKGCGVCVDACVYAARTLDPVRRVTVVNEAVCQGCGACASA